MHEFESVAGLIESMTPEDPVYCLRPRRLTANARLFLDGFPGDVLYAVKSNPMPEVVDLLHAAGVRHFDTASPAEIAFVRGRHPDSRAYFMHPVKGATAMRDAYHRHGVRHFVLDHRDELARIRAVLPMDDVVAVVRMATPGAARFNLSDKFGATAAETVDLLRRAASSGLRPGLCFHVGSQCLSPQAWTGAFALAREALVAADVAIACLDVGGGFPAHYLGATPPEAAAFFDAIRAGLATLGLDADCRVLCEPGRALVADAMSVLTRVMLRKDDRLYLNDGIYGSFIAYTLGIRCPVRPHRRGGTPSRAQREFTLFGPTCDSLDVLPCRVVLPVDTAEGDYLEFGQMGAYSAALRTGFNGFFPQQVVAVTEDGPVATPVPTTSAGSGEATVA